MNEVSLFRQRPHNIMCHMSFAYLKNTSCNIPPFLKKKKQLKTSHLSLVYRSVRNTIAYSHLEPIQIDQGICSISITVLG